MAKESGNRGRRDREETSEFSDRLVAINRVSKTVKGGKRHDEGNIFKVGDMVRIQECAPKSKSKRWEVIAE